MTREKLFWGIDEAGRGPVLGPMVVALVGITESAQVKLQQAGVSDSKSFGSSLGAHLKRMDLVGLIEQEASFVDVRVVLPAEIDFYTSQGKLNDLERRCARELILQACPQGIDSIVADGQSLFSPLCLEFPSLQAINKADAVDVSVSAASIVAKTRRDLAFMKLVESYQQEFPFFTRAGGGYMNLPTKRFMRAYKEKYGKYPQETRTSWNLSFIDI